MGLAIDEDRIFSKETPHTGIRHGDHWVVSWLPDRKLGRNQAITAMTLVWQVALDGSVHGSRWPFICAWAGELGLTGQEAVAIIAAAPEPGEEGRAGD